jgi:hypothetical protein
LSSSNPTQYPPNPYSPQATLGPPNKPTGVATGSSSGGGWKWLLIILGIGGMGMIACCGVCGGAFYFMMSAIEQTEPYKLAMEKVRESVEVDEKIGNPIEDSAGFNNQSTEQDFATGSARMRFGINIKGPKGAGSVSVSATKDGDQWTLRDCTVTFPDGTKQQLAEEPSSEAEADSEDQSEEMKEVEEATESAAGPP